VPGESLFVDNAVQRSHVVDRVDSSNVYKHSIEQLLADLYIQTANAAVIVCLHADYGTRLRQCWPYYVVAVNAVTCKHVG